jgi:hypothetical protein
MREVRIFVNGRAVRVPEGVPVAVALARAEVWATRRGGDGSPRGPLCGMGICYECRVTIDGDAHRLSCQTPCTEGLRVETG